MKWRVSTNDELGREVFDNREDALAIFTHWYDLNMTAQLDYSHDGAIWICECLAGRWWNVRQA